MPSSRSFIRRISLAGAAGAGALILLTACGGEAAQPGHDMAAMHGASPTGSASSQPSQSFNDADVMFAQMMIPHHQQAVEMAELAETRASDPEIKEIAAKIKAEQDPEIQKMKGLLQAWGQPEQPHEGMGHGMPGMVSAEGMEVLKNAKGTAFDKLFAEHMIAHHEGAIEMARTEQAQGADNEAKELAKKIETSQEAEVGQLRKILNRL